MPMDTLGKRLAAAMKQSKLNNSELARLVTERHTSISPQAIGKVINGGSKTMVYENIVGIADVLDVSTQWLADGIGEPTDGAEERVPDGVARIPYYDVRASMGPGLILPDAPDVVQVFTVTYEYLQSLPAYTSIKNLCIVMGHGESMKGLYKSEDLLIIDTGVRSFDNSGVYFYSDKEGNGFIKRLQRTGKAGVFLALSDNIDYTDYEILADDITVHAKVLREWIAG